jgi:rare lipoprotein A (peptidoglycan hydrolase)
MVYCYRLRIPLECLMIRVKAMLTFRTLSRVTILAAFPLLAGCSAMPMPSWWTRRETPRGRPGVVLASWYGPGFVGRRTADGERFNENALTAASRDYPLGSRVEVTNLHNGRSVVVRINDRGPYVRGRRIDLSKGAARRIGLIGRGVGAVRVTRLDGPAYEARHPRYVRMRHYRRHARHRARRNYLTPYI